MLDKKEILLSNIYYEKWATLYRDTEIKTKACILYFHGGGLLYGRRDDLPDIHISTFVQAGYAIIAFDYPLAPAAKIDTILSDVCASITDFSQHMTQYMGESLPFFLWGRSAGTYLCLLASISGKIPAPTGVISYYGYGLLCDGWFTTPSNYYRSLPLVDESCFKNVSDQVHANGDLDTHYSTYIFARQTGKWLELIDTEKEKLFYLNHTLRLCNSFPFPLFCAHSIQDPDVPYSEFQALSERFSPKQFIAPCKDHDFDRDSASAVTARLLRETLIFLEQFTF